MRKLMAFVLCVLMFPITALGEVDLSEYTLDQLYSLRGAIDERIALLKEEQSLPVYESGTYLVGEEIPAGIYLLEEKGYALFPSVLVRAGIEENSELISYDLVIHCAVINLTAGRYVTFTDVTAYPFDSAPACGLDAENAAGEGGYWVGRQIPAGKYQITPDEKSPLSSYSVYNDILGMNAQLLKFEVVSHSTEIFLEEEQYISLSGCSIAFVEG